MGHLSFQLMNSKEKTVQSIVLAQTTPSLLEWMRKQVRPNLLCYQYRHSIMVLCYCCAYNLLKRKVNVLIATYRDKKLTILFAVIILT